MHGLRPYIGEGNEHPLYAGMSLAVSWCLQDRMVAILYTALLYLWVFGSLGLDYNASLHHCKDCIIKHECIIFHNTIQSLKKLFLSGCLPVAILSSLHLDLRRWEEDERQQPKRVMSRTEGRPCTTWVEPTSVLLRSRKDAPLAEYSCIKCLQHLSA